MLSNATNVKILVYSYLADREPTLYIQENNEVNNFPFVTIDSTSSIYQSVKGELVELVTIPIRFYTNDKNNLNDLQTIFNNMVLALNNVSQEVNNSVIQLLNYNSFERVEQVGNAQEYYAIFAELTFKCFN